MSAKIGKGKGYNFRSRTANLKPRRLWLRKISILLLNSWNVTCHVKSHVTCNPKQINERLLNPDRRPATRFHYFVGMESWVERKACE